MPASVGTSRLRVGEIPADNLSYGVKATVVCFRGGKAPTRRTLGAASLISFVMPGHFRVRITGTGIIQVGNLTRNLPVKRQREVLTVTVTVTGGTVTGVRATIGAQRRLAGPAESRVSGTGPGGGRCRTTGSPVRRRLGSASVDSVAAADQKQ